MRNFSLYLVVVLLAFFSQAFAQEKKAETTEKKSDAAVAEKKSEATAAADKKADAATENKSETVLLAESKLQETIDKCKATEKDKPTLKLIMQKVDAACELVNKEGDAAFAKFVGKDSEFIFCGTYIFVHDPANSVNMFVPTQPKFIGKKTDTLKDSKGKYFAMEFRRIAKEKGSGWVDYTWPKPGEKTFSNKVSYVKLAKHGDKEYVIGSGVYDYTMEDVKKELGENK